MRKIMVCMTVVGVILLVGAMYIFGYRKAYVGELNLCPYMGIVDGDTIYVEYEGNKEKVRLIGVDAPESVHLDSDKNNRYGYMAKQYLEGMLSGCEYVYLEFDKELRDRYGRLLAYVYTDMSGDISSSVNYTILKQGYGINYEYAPNVKYAPKLSAVCHSARQKKIGLWGYEDFYMIIQ